MGTQETRTQFESFVNSEGCKALAYVNQWQAAKMTGRKLNTTVT